MPKNPRGDADALSELTDKLETCDTEILNFVVALKAKNLELQKKIAKLQAEIVSKNNEIAAILGNEISDSESEALEHKLADEIAGVMARVEMRVVQSEKLSADSTTQVQPNHPPAANPQD